jgi:hypothetical protein
MMEELTPMAKMCGISVHWCVLYLKISRAHWLMHFNGKSSTCAHVHRMVNAGDALLSRQCSIDATDYRLYA